MKKILFILDEFYPVTSAPGVRIKSFLDEFEENSAILLGGAESKPQKFSFALLPVKRPNEKNLIRFIIFLLKMNLVGIIQTYKIKPKAVVVSIPKYELLLSLPLIRLSGAKIVLDIRDSEKFINYSAYFSHFFPKRLAALFGRIVKSFVNELLKICLRISDVITVANEGIYVSLGKYKNKSRIINNGVDTKLFCPQKKNQEKENGKLNLVYVGNFSEKDDFQIFSGLEEKTKRKIFLHLVGEGRNRQKIIDYLAKAGLNLKFYGRIGHQLLPALLNEMDVGFIFRDGEVQESIPVAIYEFCAMGLMTISNKVGIMSQFIEKNRLGKVVSNVSELDFLLNTMLAGRRKESRSCARYLRNKAVKEFSRKKQAQLFKQEIEKLSLH